jgi:hypothetical protein
VQQPITCEQSFSFSFQETIMVKLSGFACMFLTLCFILAIASLVGVRAFAQSRPFSVAGSESLAGTSIFHETTGSPGAIAGPVSSQNLNQTHRLIQGFRSKASPFRTPVKPSQLQ